MNAPPSYASQKKRELKICYDSAVSMEALATLVILLHPLAALAVIREFFNQRKWRQEGRNYLIICELRPFQDMKKRATEFYSM
jgi:hypothetical protein